jgi:hypothetical protein
MSNYKERYTPTLMAANSSFTLTGSQTGGFLAVTAGTITITANGVNELAAFPCAAGQYVPLPLVFNYGETIVVTLAGGASGTLLT